MKKKIGSWLGIAISVLFIVLLVRSLHIDEVKNELRQAQYFWLLPAVVFSLLSFIFRAERFRLILRPLSFFSLKRSYAYIAINYMGNNILPARAGEALLSYVVRQKEGISFSSSLAVTLLGRVVDGLLMLSLLGVTLLFLPFPSWVNTIILFGGVIFGGMFAGLVWLIFGKSQQQRAIQKAVHKLFPHKLQPVLAKLFLLAGHFKNGLLPLRSPKIASKTALFTFLIWSCESVVYACVAQSLGLSFDVVTVLFALALTNLASSVPSGPSSIGTFEGILLLGLGVLHFGPAQAAAYAVVLHVTQVVPITLIGVVSYARLTLRGGKTAPVPTEQMMVAD